MTFLFSIIETHSTPEGSYVHRKHGRPPYFQAWCAAEQIPDSAPTLLDFFHQTGVLFYDKRYFSGQIILDQAWAIAAVYKVLDKDAKYFRYLRQNQGKLSYFEICDIWREYADEERALFLRFMLSCELCFETTENKASNPPLKDRTFVVPQLLPEKMNATVELGLSSLPFTDSRAFAFLPTSLIQRFIIKAQHLAEVEDIWQKGIWLRYGAAEVLVQAVYGRKPRLEIRHNEAAAQELVARVWAQFDLLEGKERLRERKQGVEDKY